MCFMLESFQWLKYCQIYFLAVKLKLKRVGISSIMMTQISLYDEAAHTS